MHPAQAIQAAAQILREAGVDSADHDARALLRHVTGDTLSQALMRTDLSEEEHARFLEMIQRRRTEPLQYLLGTAPFRYRELAVGPGVFVPRPETEMVAQAVIDLATGMSGPRVLELCAGTGAIIGAVASETTIADGLAVERSPQAFEYLERNLEGTGVRAVCADITEVDWEPESFDIVVANPPYIPWSQRDELPADVLREPHEALFADDDGLALYPVIAQIAQRVLTPGGWLVCEHGDDQGGAVSSIVRDHGFDQVEVCRDLTDRPRYVKACWPSCLAQPKEAA